MYFLSQKLMSTNKFECNEFEKYKWVDLFWSYTYTQYKPIYKYLVFQKHANFMYSYFPDGKSL